MVVGWRILTFMLTVRMDKGLTSKCNGRCDGFHFYSIDSDGREWLPPASSFRADDARESGLPEFMEKDQIVFLIAQS
jgi:hypothetical protein